MLVLLVANSNELNKKLAALNPELEYCALVIDEVESAKETLERVGLSQVSLYPMSELKACVENLDYALINLVPFCFHYDLSQVFQFRCDLLQYVIAFNDLHNFFVPVDVYKKFFREEWLMTKLSLKALNLDTPYYDAPLPVKVMDQQAIDADTITFEGKYYPETRDENIKILDDYLTLCEENNIRPIMFIVTESEKHMANFNPQLLEEFYVLIEQTCQKHPSAVFFDGWKLKDFTYTDFFDHGHMNRHGAAKFSAYLNNFIEELEFCNHFEV